MMTGTAANGAMVAMTAASNSPWCSCSICHVTGCAHYAGDRNGWYGRHLLGWQGGWGGGHGGDSSASSAAAAGSEHLPLLQTVPLLDLIMNATLRVA